jgi:hypothetical protein
MENQLPSNTRQPGQNLLRCEGRIKNGLTELHAGIMEIHDNNYWKDTNDSFVDYCRDRMGLDKNQAHRMLVHGNVMRNIAEHMVPEHDSEGIATEQSSDDILINEKNRTPKRTPNQGQAAELNKLPDEEQSEAWDSATGEAEGKPTVDDVKREVQKRKATPRQPVLDDPGLSISVAKLDKQIKALDTVARVASEIAHNMEFGRPAELMNALHTAKLEITKLKGML